MAPTSARQPLGRESAYAGHGVSCAIALAIAACGDRRAVPLYAAPESIDAGGTGASWVPRPCVIDESVVLETTTPSNVSTPGSLYSAPPLSQYAPRPISVRLTTTAGSPVPACDVAWTPAPGSGWAFPIAPSTDVNGQVDAWWTAGPDATQSVRASVVIGDGGDVSTIITGTTEARPVRPTTVYLDYPSEPYDGYSVEVLPLQAPPLSHVGALWGANCGASFTNDALQDSGGFVPGVYAYCENTSADDATVVDAPASTCGPSDGGMSCSQPYPWKLGASYRFELETHHLVAAHTDYAFFITDLATGARTKLAELRYGNARRPTTAYSYLWGDAFAPHCLAIEPISARFGPVKKNDGGTVTDVNVATLSREYDLSIDQTCVNYDYGASQGAFFLSTGGLRVGFPRAPGSPAPVITLP